jgi:hypothetical protein
MHQATAIAITTGKLTYTGTDTMNANAAAEPPMLTAIGQAAFARWRSMPAASSDFASASSKE